MVGIDLKTKNETDYYFDGINFKLFVVIKENNEYGIGVESKCPLTLLDMYDEVLPVEKSKNNLYKRSNVSKPNNDSSQNRAGTGFMDITVNQPPTSIYVGIGPTYNNVTIYNINTQEYIKNCTSNEIPYTYHAEAIKACAISIKMFAWWCWKAFYHQTYGYDVHSSNGGAAGDQAYILGFTNYPTEILDGVNAIMNYYILSASGKCFHTNCNDFNGIPSTEPDYDYQSSGHCVQTGANSLASNYSTYYPTWQSIIHYYFDNSSYNNPGTGTVQIGTHTGW